MDQAERARASGPTISEHDISLHEWKALARRRDKSHVLATQPVTGLALSGGGVRSATFCIGLLRALSKNHVLHRFDYLSTVSGGGYAGASFGRLFKREAEAEKVEKGLADDNSIWLWWLRRNGRYLLPAGTRDVLQAWAGQLRGFIATQFEVTVLLLLASCVVVFPHLLHYPWFASPVPTLIRTLWWLATPVAAYAAVFMAFAYWWSRDPDDGTGRSEDQKNHGDMAVCLGAVLLGLWLLSPLWLLAGDQHANLVMLTIGGILLTAPLARAWLAFVNSRRSNETREASRNLQDQVRYTVRLSTALKWLLGLAVIGALDLFSWFLADDVATAARHGSVLTGAGLAASLVALARFILPLLHARQGQNSKTQLSLMLVANVCGLVLLGLLAVFWLSALQYFVFLAPLARVSAPWRWSTVFFPCAAYVMATNGNLQLVNRSSLHAFYRSRIARTYVSVGNSPAPGKPPEEQTHLRFPTSPLEENREGDAAAIHKLTELMDGDDIELADYAPHDFGGPIHLINCCINQTVDDRTGTFNADRKGVYLTVSSLGIETGTKLPQSFADNDPRKPGTLGNGTLAQWIAISGAAAGSGMGSMTRTGVSALLFLSGLRLGYWWNRHPSPSQQPAARWAVLSKSRAVLQEMLARFPGLQNPVWYLSDGGHFDNTGVYSLLKRKLEVIVLADCGADPEYGFADMENLIRKARIDMDTVIDFIDPASLPKDLGKPLRNRFGTPDSITPSPGGQHLLLARITYPDHSVGCLLVVKPRLCDDMPLDIAGYADRNRDFPQQSTSQQFFDETQWESYCQLGEVLGKVIDSPLLERLPTLSASGRIIRSISAVGESDSVGPTRRQRIGATLGASLSVGVLATVLLTAWQAWDSHAGSSNTAAQAIDSQQRVVDTVQIDLESGIAYDPNVHARLYALLVQLDDTQVAADLPRAMHQLAGTLDRTCSQLGRNHPLLDRCLEDEAALREATARPTRWQTAQVDYENPFSSPADAASDDASILFDADMQNVCARLATPQQVRMIKPAAGADPLPASGSGWSQPVFLYSADGLQAFDCAQLLVRWLPTQKGFAGTTPRALPAPVPLHGDANAIELWWPNATRAPPH